PAIIRSNVDLPQPEGPTRTTNSPSRIEMSTPWMTAVAPKDFRTSRIATDAIHSSQGRRLGRCVLLCVSAPVRGSPRWNTHARKIIGLSPSEKQAQLEPGGGVNGRPFIAPSHRQRGGAGR